jgi:hypothetical protein
MGFDAGPRETGGINASGLRKWRRMIERLLRWGDAGAQAWLTRECSTRVAVGIGIVVAEVTGVDGRCVQIGPRGA